MTRSKPGKAAQAACKQVLGQLNGMGADDEGFRARFTVLCEYVLHHVKEEEGELFPQLEKAPLDWEAIAGGMQQRRDEAMPQDEAVAADAAGDARA